MTIWGKKKPEKIARRCAKKPPVKKTRTRKSPVKKTRTRKVPSGRNTVPAAKVPRIRKGRKLPVRAESPPLESPPTPLPQGKSQTHLQSPQPPPSPAPAIASPPPHSPQATTPTTPHTPMHTSPARATSPAPLNIESVRETYEKWLRVSSFLFLHF